MTAEWQNLVERPEVVECDRKMFHIEDLQSMNNHPPNISTTSLSKKLLIPPTAVSSPVFPKQHKRHSSSHTSKHTYSIESENPSCLQSAYLQHLHFQENSPYPTLSMKGCTLSLIAKFTQLEQIARTTTNSPDIPGKQSITYAVAILQALT